MLIFVGSYIIGHSPSTFGGLVLHFLGGGPLFLAESLVPAQSGVIFWGFTGKPEVCTKLP